MAVNYDQPSNNASFPGDYCPPVPRVIVDPTLTIYGRAADAYVTGNVLRTKLDGDAAMSNSISLIDGKLQMSGFCHAEQGTVPHKGDDRVDWIPLSKVAYTGEYDDLYHTHTKLSEFTNDTGFVTGEEASELKKDVSKLSEGLNITKGELYRHTADSHLHIDVNDRDRWDNAAHEIHGMGHTIAGMDARLHVTEIKAEEAAHGVSDLRATVFQNKERINGLSEHTQHTDEVLQELDSKVDEISRKVDPCVDHERRISSLERVQDGMAKQVTNISNTVATQVGQIHDLYEELNDEEEVLKMVGLEDKTKKYPFQLSGGEQQRVCIARALVKQAGIIICDEPTGALNSKTSIEVLDTFSKFNQEGQSIILVTHDMQTALRGNRILYFKDGNIKGEFKLPKYKGESQKRRNDLKAFLEQMEW